MTSMSSSYSCQTGSPSLPNQFTEVVRGEYENIGAEVQSIDMRRDDEGNIAGQVTLRNPASGDIVTTNCMAEVDEMRYQWTCSG